MDNCTSSLNNLLAILKVKFTKQYLEDTILSHPDHPSLLTVSDTLLKYQIENLPVKVDGSKLKEFPLPCIVQLSDSGGMFHVLVQYSEEELVYLSDKGKQVKIPKEQFLEKWTGICLLVEISELSGEADIEKKLSERKIMMLFKWAGVLFLFLWIALSFFNAPLLQESGSLFLGGYTLLKFIGLTMGVMLLWYEVDKYNPTLQSFCTGGTKVNCGSVLSSKYAEILNGKLSLGLLVFAYFFGTSTFLLFNGFSSATLMPLAYLSFATLPMVVLSAYYQGVVIKQWCKFCIVVQAVLLVEAAVGFLGGFHRLGTELYSLPLLIALFLLPIALWKWLKPLLEIEKEANLHMRSLKKIKNNPVVLQGLLSKTRKITHSAEGLGIALHSGNSSINVIKVCNPFCGPCAEAHPVLDELVKDGKINLQVLFSVSTNAEDPRTKTAIHLLAIDAKRDTPKTLQALDDWYRAKEKDYDTFAKKYPMNGELGSQDEKIAAMSRWCETEKITHIPTIFINGHELPKEYTVVDLKEVLN